MRAFFVSLLLVWISGCATTTKVLVLDPARQYAPTTDVLVLFEPPPQPYVRIARLESKGQPGGTEVEVIEDARAKAGGLGAHALIVEQSTSYYQPPVVIEDPWPPLFPWYYDRWYGYRHPFHPPPMPYYAPERTLPGGYVPVVKSLAIRFDEEGMR